MNKRSASHSEERRRLFETIGAGAGLLLFLLFLWVTFRGAAPRLFSRRTLPHYLPSLVFSHPADKKAPAETAPAGLLPEWASKKDSEIDIGLAALHFAKDFYPDIDVSRYNRQIDVLAQEVRRLAGGTKDPDRRIRSLNTVLYQQQKFHGERNAAIQRDPAFYYLNNLLDTKRGNCFTMPLLYLAVSQRLGWPVRLIHVPDHSFVRYVDPRLKEQNIEATSGGGYVPDEQYKKDFRVSDAGIKSGAYLRSLTSREVLGDLAAINGIAFGKRGELAKALIYLQSATQWNPRLVDGWANLAYAANTMAKHLKGTEAVRYQKMAALSKTKCDELGFVHPREVPRLASHRRSAR